MHEASGDIRTPLSILERAAIEELDQTTTGLSRLERLLIAAIVEIGRLGDDSTQHIPLPQLKGLTNREREVLELIVDGHTNRSAASVLGISARTVEVHRLRILRKLGVRTSAELVRVVTGIVSEADKPLGDRRAA